MKTEIEIFFDREEMRLDDMRRHLDKLENNCSGDCYNCAQNESLGDDCVFNKERIKRNRAWMNNRSSFIRAFKKAYKVDKENGVIE